MVSSGSGDRAEKLRMESAKSCARNPWQAAAARQDTHPSGLRPLVQRLVVKTSDHAGQAVVVSVAPAPFALHMGDGVHGDRSGSESRGEERKNLHIGS